MFRKASYKSKMIIDFHTHCFPEKIASAALMKLSLASGGLNYYHNGTLEDLKRLNKENNVDMSVVLNIATNAKQMKSVNDFAASMNDGKTITAFGSVFPDAPDAVEELERIKELGLKGVKFHPDYQGFFVDDPKMKPIYKKISELGLITVFHAGRDLGFHAPFHAMPDNMIGALKMLDAPVVAAHWGGSELGPEVIEKLCGLPLYFDTGFGYSHIARSEAMEIIEKHGADKILFATDAPWQTAEMNLKLINTLELSEDEKELILHKNAEKLLGIN